MGRLDETIDGTYHDEGAGEKRTAKNLRKGLAKVRGVVSVAVLSYLMPAWSKARFMSMIVDLHQGEGHKLSGENDVAGEYEIVPGVDEIWIRL